MTNQNYPSIEHNGINNQNLISKVQLAFQTIRRGVTLRAKVNLGGHHIFQRFAIIGHARTGSNYLLDGLKNSNSIRTYHEIFAAHNREIGKNFEKVFSCLYQKESRKTKIVGFKLFYNHLTEEEWQKFILRDEFKIIHLTRANRLRTIVSLDIALQTGQWTRSILVKEKKLAEKQISLELSSLIKRLEEIQNQEALARERFKDRQMLEIVYEELTQHPREKFHEVGGFLGVDDIDFNTIKIMKQNPEKLEHLIVNYEEVQQLLKNSKFADCLNE